MASDALLSGLHWLNAASQADAENAFLDCCGSKKFSLHLASRRPFPSAEDLVAQSRDVWWKEVDIMGWNEAFSAHPRIGDRLDSKLKTSVFSEGEQTAAKESSSDSVSQELAEWNRKYEAKFGHVFLICAAGMSAPAILAQLKRRFENLPIHELQNAAKEQQKITELRIAKLLTQKAAANQQVLGLPLSNNAAVPAIARVARIASHVAPSPSSFSAPFIHTSAPASSSLSGPAGGAPAAYSATAPPPSSHPHISTHVLDIVLGKPGAGIPVVLHQRGPLGPLREETWIEQGRGVTNSDGRCAGLLDDAKNTPALQDLPLAFRLTYDTLDYFARVHGGASFFPTISVVFELKPWQRSEKVHVPVLLAPHAYSTYRGS